MTRRMPLLNRLALAALGVFVLLIVGPSACEAQDPFGWLSAPDRVWENWQRHNRWMYEVDNTDPKSWGAHALVDESLGKAISVVSFRRISFRRGRQLICALYVVREANGVLFEHSRKRLDPVMDAVAPCTMAFTRVRLRVQFRW